ncbi:MAG: hypothetical protein ACRCSQ_00795 [Bacteroidales bacterium]
MRKSLTLLLSGLIGVGGVGFANEKSPVKTVQNSRCDLKESMIQPVQNLMNLPVQLVSAEAAKVIEFNNIQQQLRMPRVDLKGAKSVSKAPKSSASKSVSALPQGIEGSKQYEAVDYFDKVDLNWDGTITADATIPNKIWISNLLLNGLLNTPTEIFGMVDAATKKISIPCGQILAYLQSGEEVLLCGINETGMLVTGKSITASFDAAGKITFNDYIGANVGEIPQGWFELLTQIKAIDKTKIAADAHYLEPQGLLFQGMLSDMTYFTNSFSYSPAYVNNEFRNSSKPANATLQWSLEELGDDGNIIDTKTSTEQSIIVNDAPTYFNMPRLTAKINNTEDAFILAQANDPAKKSFYELSGRSYVKVETIDGVPQYTKTSGFTRANPANQVGYYSIGDPDEDGMTPYLYGTGKSSNGTQHSVISRFQKPLSTLYFEGVEFFTADFSAPALTKFTCQIVRIKDGENEKWSRLDTIATSVIYTENIASLGNRLAVLSFKNFTVLDDMGFESEVEYLEMDDAFIVELYGFSKKGCSMAVFSEKIQPGNNINNKGKSYFTLEEDKAEGYPHYQYLSPLPMQMNLYNAAYAYLVPEVANPVIQLDKQGASASFKFYPFYNGIWIENE